MNAYELADQVEMWGEDLLALNMKGGIPVIEGAKMLRQQQAEIGCYKIELELHKAMIQDLENGLDSSIKLNKAQAERQVKELTDEEILQFQDKVPYTLGSDLIDFARAILRKAQEK